MPGSSCSSDTLNGCSSCSPNLTLWAISSSSNIGAELGYSAYDGSGKKYTTQAINSYSTCTTTWSGWTWVGNFPDLERYYYYGNFSSNESGAVTSTYNYFIDEYGEIYIWIDSNANGNSSGNDYDPGEFVICYPTGQGRATSTTSYKAGGSSKSKGYLSGCGDDGRLIIQTSNETNCSSSYQSSVKNSSTNPNCPKGTDSGTGTDCGIPSFSVTDPSPSATVKSQKGNTREVYGCPSVWLYDKTCTANCSVDKKAVLSTEITPQFLYGKNQQVVNKKISLLENNNEQNCAGAKCGDGKKDDCWGGAGGFNLPSKDTGVAVKLKFKIGALKEDFKKTYKSVSGKVNFYIPSEQDTEEGRTPCCNDDFSGTVFKESGYSISSGSSTFKDDYLAVDCGDADNGSVSESKSISICFTVDDVSFS
jgi:hypothetical protein